MSVSTTKPVYINPKSITEFIVYAKDKLPNEACGLLLGSENEKGYNVVYMALLENVKPSPGYFEMDPSDVLEINKLASKQGIAVIGTIHSHPFWPSYPSSTDIEFMTMNGGAWIITSLSDKTTQAYHLGSLNIPVELGI